MKELICPKCGNIFKVDETSYNSIVNQIKNAEFNAEVDKRIEEFQKINKADQERITVKLEQEFNEKINKKNLDIVAKNAEIDKIKTEKNIEVERINNEKNSEILLLKNQIDKLSTQNKMEIQLALSEKERQIESLNSLIEKNNTNLRIAIVEEKNKLNSIIQEKESEIIKLKNEIVLKSNEAKLMENNLKKNFDDEKKLLQNQIDYYKDLKTKLSTKMIGETLEQHCKNAFETYLRPMMPNSYFDKDNDIIDGTKGDFVFRDKDDNFEYVSIMFEMKNEMDTTSSKHKNEDFFKKLNDDRDKKKCEFAVLVSLLEVDNELYNNGIVNVSHLYPNMYVIRPQFFIPFIMLIVQTSRKSLEYKKQLDFVQSREIDVTNFENKLLEFQDKFGRNYRLASEKFKTAIDEIDTTIKHLEKIKKELIGCDNNLRLANERAEDLSVKKLTRDNKTMKAKFDEINKNLKNST